MVNFSDVTAWFNELRDKYGIYTVWVGYDQWGANQWADEMKQNGYVLEPVIQGGDQLCQHDACPLSFIMRFVQHLRKRSFLSAGRVRFFRV